jgi:hypothetical protein
MGGDCFRKVCLLGTNILSVCSDQLAPNIADLRGDANSTMDPSPHPGKSVTRVGDLCWNVRCQAFASGSKEWTVEFRDGQQRH